MTATVTAIIPTHNDGPVLKTCIESLFSQTYGVLEVIVIDDASTDGTQELLAALAAQYPNLKHQRISQKSGAAKARNVGFDLAQGEFLVLIDGDMWAPPQWVEHLLAPLLEGIADVTGGPDRVPDSAPLASRCIGYSMDSVLTNGGLRRGDTTLVSYLPGTGNMAILTSFLRQAGHFDESFHDTGEDKEWLLRVKHAGARFLYVPQALAWHERRPDIFLHAKKQLLSGRRRLDIWEKDPSSFEWAHAAPAILIVFLALGWSLPWIRWAWLGVLFLGTTLVMIDCLRGARELGSPRAFFTLVFTSTIIPLGYGLGVLWRGAERLWSKFTGKP